jgi:hypothetical protein
LPVELWIWHSLREFAVRWVANVKPALLADAILDVDTYESCARTKLL